MSEPRANRRSRVLVAVVGLTACLAGLIYLAVAFDWRGGLSALAGSDWGRALAVCVGLLLTTWVLRALRWRLCVQALGRRLDLRTSLEIVAMSQGAAQLTPGQTGEAIKVAVSGRDDRAATAGGFLAERAADVIVLAGLALIGAAIAAEAPYFAALAGLGSGGALTVMLFGSSAVRVEQPRWLANLARGAAAVASPPARATRFACLTVGHWLLSAAIVQIAARTCGVDLDFTEALAVMGAATFAGVLSLSPAGLGVADAGMASLLTAYGGDPSAALATALLARLVGLAGLAISTVFGFIALRRQAW